MPSTPARWMGGLVLAAALPFGRIAAQDTLELARRVDAAVSLRDEAMAAVTAYRLEHAVSRSYTDTVAILDGAMRILADREFLPLVRTAAARADAFIRQRAGRRSSLLGGTVFGVWTDSGRRKDNGVIASPRINGHETDERNSIAEPRWLAQVFEEYAQARLGTNGKPHFELWLSGGLPVDTATNSDWRTVRLELVSSGTTIAHRCYAGDIKACKATLGLVEEADPAMAWYDASTRRTLVLAASKAGQLDQGLAVRCHSGSDADCLTLMRTSSAMSALSIPQGSRRARTTLVQQAFAMGGSGTLERLAASDDSTAIALSALAKAPIDSVVAQWQRHAHDGGVESEAATPVIVLVSLGWILVMGGLSLRSPRWR